MTNTMNKTNLSLPIPDMSSYVGHTLSSIEKELILSTMGRCAGNRTWASEILGISLLELRDKLCSYGRPTGSPQLGIDGYDPDKTLLS